MKYAIVSLLVLVSCFAVAGRDLVKVKYSSYFIDADEQRLEKFVIRIPKNYRLIKYGVNAEWENRYVYPDSSALYISNTYFSANSKNIEGLGDSIYQYRYAKQDVAKAFNEPILPDTFELNGVTSDSLYWKDIWIKGISIGYSNVPQSRKAIFDEALTTFKKIK